MAHGRSSEMLGDDTLLSVGHAFEDAHLLVQPIFK